MLDREQIYEAFDNGLIGLDDIIDISQKNGYNQALEDFLKEFHKHLCDENCGERKCVDDMDKCVYWFYANEVAEKLTK